MHSGLTELHHQPFPGCQPLFSTRSNMRGWKHLRAGTCLFLQEICVSSSSMACTKEGPKCYRNTRGGRHNHGLLSDTPPLTYPA
jgi:hypothetical protein